MCPNQFEMNQSTIQSTTMLWLKAFWHWSSHYSNVPPPACCYYCTKMSQTPWEVAHEFAVRSSVLTLKLLSLFKCPLSFQNFNRNQSSKSSGRSLRASMATTTYILTPPSCHMTPNGSFLDRNYVSVWRRPCLCSYIYCMFTFVRKHIYRAWCKCGDYCVFL